MRCMRSGIVCEGYEKNATFVNRDASNIKATGRQALSNAFRKKGCERRLSGVVGSRKGRVEGDSKFFFSLFLLEI